MINRDLDHFIELYGQSDLLRLAEILGPLTEDVFVNRLYMEIEKIVKTIEEGRKERSKDGENRLTLELVTSLRQTGYLADNDPTHGGHVDLLVRPKNKPEMKWYGEAKIWDGVEYLHGGITQLITRYASGRERRLGFLVYFRCDSLMSKMGDWQEHLEHDSETYKDDFFKIDDYSFVSSHQHSSGSKIFVRHFAININWKPEGKRRKKPATVVKS